MVLLMMIHTSLAKPLCHLDESSALIEFKQSFKTNRTAFMCVPKVESWSLDGHEDCCSWDGIKCDEATGHVTSLGLSNSCLFGTLSSNTSLFRLLHLESLNLAYNDFNSSSIPYSFGNLSRLQYLNLSYSKFSGRVPSDISWLHKLVSLDLDLMWDLEMPNMWDLEMPNIDNFVQNLTMLREFHLSRINISSPFPRVLTNFSSLKSFKLRYCQLQGEFPVSIFQLPNLEVLDISENYDLSSFIPDLHWGNSLKSLSLSKVNFSGEIPNSLWELKDLEILDLHGNNLSGTVDLHKLKKLQALDLSFNNISFISKVEINATLPQLSILVLVSCNLHEFPKFLGYQSKLWAISLSYNKIGGSIPMWMLNGSRESLSYVDLSHNFLTSLGNNQIHFPLPNLVYLDISSNRLKAKLPSPPRSTTYYNISNNFLFGKIHSICSWRSLVILDLSNNNLNGTIPSCVGNFDSLSFLNLGKNKLEGMIPPAYSKGCVLKMIDLTENRLQGSVPRSLANCTMLEYLNLAHNQILDGFPLWLSKLTKLKAVILKSNKFHGPIEAYHSQFNFSNMHIMDLSYNSFSGKLPSKLLQSFHAMKETVSQDRLEYMNTYENISSSSIRIERIFEYGMTLMNKGVEREYLKVPFALMQIDFSNNKFEGYIPDLIGDLKSLISLNLSNNVLTGSIPPSLANLTLLESLDLSRNKLSGEIPQKLAQLTFLSSFNVSDNQLLGPIPRGNQFNTFAIDSFAMNEGLRGSHLPRKCTTFGDNLPLPPSPQEELHEGFLLNLDWKFVLIGAGVGFLIGVVLGNLIIDEKSKWFLHYSKKIAKRWKGSGRH